MKKTLLFLFAICALLSLQSCSGPYILGQSCEHGQPAPQPSMGYCQPSNGYYQTNTGNYPTSTGGNGSGWNQSGTWNQNSNYQQPTQSTQPTQQGTPRTSKSSNSRKR